MIPFTITVECTDETSWFMIISLGLIAFSAVGTFIDSVRSTQKQTRMLQEMNRAQMKRIKEEIREQSRWK